MSNEKKTVKVDMNAPLVTTGADIPPGTYPAAFRGFGEATWMKSSFGKDGEDKEQLRMPAEFAIRIKDGSIEVIDGLVGPPDGGKVNRKSNMHKLLKALANGDPKLWDSATDGVAAGVSLGAFRGRPCMIAVKHGGKNKDFPTVESYMAPVDGAKYPSEEEMKKLGEDAPF